MITIPADSSLYPQQLCQDLVPYSATLTLSTATDPDHINVDSSVDNSSSSQLPPHSTSLTSDTMKSPANNPPPMDTVPDVNMGLTSIIEQSIAGCPLHMDTHLISDPSDYFHLLTPGTIQKVLEAEGSKICECDCAYESD